MEGDDDVDQSQVGRRLRDQLSSLGSSSSSLEGSTSFNSNSNNSLRNNFSILLHEQINMSSLDKWLIFSIVKPQLASQIKLACVFGLNGNEAIFVTKDDDVYALGTNSSSCLGLGDANSSLEPRKVDALSKKRVCNLSYGTGPHVVANTESGELYTWGHNGYQQLGNGSASTSHVPTQITGNLHGKRIIDIACGSHHTLVLTEDGEVFAWGQNNCGQVGIGSTANQPTPKKISFVGIPSNKKVISISCGQISSIAVIETGEVFAWGYNGNGQLGLGTNANQSTPCKIMNIQNIQKVVCGYGHCIALSEDGSIYSWGANTYGQLGTGSKSHQVIPVKIASELGRFVEIAASHYNHISSALTHDGKCYMWGQCRSQSLTVPTEVPFGSIHDIFACFATPSVTWKPILLTSTKINRVLDSLSQAFDDEKTSDLKFIVDDRCIYVHKAILKVRCEHFRSMFQSHWDEDQKDEIEITQFSYPVYHAFLQYIYTDEVNLPPEDAIGLLELANAYCESDLKFKCERLIRHGISVENVSLIYSAAIKYEAKDLEDYCFRFALVNLTAVVQTESFYKLDESNTKKLIVRASQNGAFRH